MSLVSQLLDIHIVQTPPWGEFKTKMGTPNVRVGDLQFTKHKIPGLPYFVGYAPRANFYKQKFSFRELKEVAKHENCIVIRFDVPNVVEEDTKSKQYMSLMGDLKKYCVKSPKSTFAKYNVLLNLNQPEEKLMENLHPKTRYNIKLSAKHGVKVDKDNSTAGFETFYKLHKDTAKRQGFLPHSEKYYKVAFETLKSYNMANILIAHHNNTPLAAWMLFNDTQTLYYPYGGSAIEGRNLMPSNLLCWEAIKLGLQLKCKLFDMWGAANDPDDPYWGFTKFKLGYGGELVKYIESYDLIVNAPIYNLFNFSYGLFWKIVKLVKK